MIGAVSARPFFYAAELASYFFESEGLAAGVRLFTPRLSRLSRSPYRIV